MRTFLFYSILSLFFTTHSSGVTAQLYQTKSYKMTIRGTSSYNEWTSEVKNVSIFGDFVIVNGVLEKIKKATVIVLTKSIQSDLHSDLMDERTHNTLKADKYPSITYEFISIKSVHKEFRRSSMIIHGTLNLAGRSKPTDLFLNITTNEKGEVTISGEKKIKMSHYGIKPPVFMLGLLSVGDEVILNYEVVLEQKVE